MLVPQGPFSSGLGATTLGNGAPEPQRQTHTAARQPHGPNEAPLLIQCGSTGRDLRAAFEFLTPTVPQPMVHTPPPQPPHLSLPLHSPHHLWIGSASLRGANTNTRMATMGPAQGAWPRNTGYWGHPKINDRLTLLPGHHMGTTGRCCSFSAGEWAGTSEHLATFEAASRQTLGPTVPFPMPSPRPATPITAEHSAQVCGPPGG